ncbi:MAG TPA: hypothetical protein VM582_09285 [Candidatus Thermoplasmatota archaeon]|nr:hypothetical protein [Candidatus Thermoplasmatota archaeon]
MGYVASGILLLLLGMPLVLAGRAALVVAAGWACLALAATLLVAHVAVGPRRRAPGFRT